MHVKIGDKMEPKQEEAVPQAAPAEEEAPAAKKQRTEEVGSADDAMPDAAAAGAAEGGDGEAAAEGGETVAAEEGGAAAEAEGGEGGEPKKPSGPIKIGYRTFQTGAECYKYFQTLMSKLRKNQNLNEYEFHMVEELVRTGHPDAPRKLGAGLSAVQIRDVTVGGASTSCFFLLRKDGSQEDVSYRKCVANLFPEMSDLTAHYNKPGGAGRGGRGRGGGRGGRGRGGRGRGRGRH